ncbi:hypothetical protein, partial [Alienimonas sp. DA493]|uniref:hypothetical protein n=1 Tax=Alienimonas sp. DA493 TaxID=3373605 RepID=UPI003754E893
RIDATPYHPDALAQAQEICRGFEGEQNRGLAERMSVGWAWAYFVAAWMGRNGLAGQGNELESGIALRFDALGGDHVVRLRSAASALDDFHETFTRCTFSTFDACLFLKKKCRDLRENAIYADPPFVEGGERYKHRAENLVKWHRDDLFPALNRFEKARVVLRAYEHPLIDALYTESEGWRRECVPGGRKSTNETAPEILLVKNE